MKDNRFPIPRQYSMSQPTADVATCDSRNHHDIKCAFDAAA